MFTLALKKMFAVLAVFAVLLPACVACAPGGGEPTSAPATQPPTLAPSPTAALAAPSPAPAATAGPKPTPPPSATAAPGGPAALRLDKAEFLPNEAIRVQVTPPGALSTNAWVGVIPSGVPHGDEAVNDENDVDYQYLAGLATEVMTFTAPHEPGAYDLRLNDGAGQEIASITFDVAIPAGDVQPGLRLAKTTLAPNEEFQVQLSAPDWYPADAWVGIIPSDVPHGDEAVNDEHDVDYQYLEELATGVMTFTAPHSPGSYDLRLNDGAGQETASVTFVVAIPTGGVQPGLQLAKTEFAPGEEIEVRFTAPSWYPADAWVGLIPSEVPHGDAGVNDENDVQYFYLDGQTSGVLVFTAPDTPGSYDLRLNDASTGGQEVASVTFEVR